MRTLAVIFAVGLCAVAAASAAPGASTGLPGTYTTNIPEFGGRYSLTLAPNGIYVVAGSNSRSRGKWRTSGRAITFSKQGDCPGTGIYTWKLTGKRLAFKEKSDGCTDRPLLLVGSVFTRK